MKTKQSRIKSAIKYWDEFSPDPLDSVKEESREIIHDENDESRLYNEKLVRRALEITPHRGLTHGIIKAFGAFYKVCGVAVCVLLSGILVYMAFYLPAFGVADTPHNNEVYERYVEKTVEETGAINAVSGMILDYRAFDTLGESHVLFTAVMCVMILLKNTATQQISDPNEKYLDLTDDAPLSYTVKCLFPFIFIFGAYVILAGHLGPGGGFAGGALLGAGMILLSCACGSGKTRLFFGEKVFKAVSCAALCFYSLSKAYSFYCGANNIESIISHGTPGAILSAGLILPLNVAVGLVVACTMFGFYSLFTKGKI